MTTDADGWTGLERVRTRPTRRVILLGVLGLLLYGAGANVSAGWVVVLAAVMLGAGPWAWFQVRRAGKGLRVRRELPPRAVAGVRVDVRVEVTARTPAMAVVRDELSGTVGVAGGLRHGSELEGSVPLRRGFTGGGRMEIRLSDPFGLVDLTLAGDVPVRTEVVPAVIPLPGGDVVAQWGVDVGDESRKAGSGAEVLGVREYTRGDPVRTIHWRSTARTGQLVVRELADDARPRVRIEIASQTWPREVLDRATEVACALAEQSRQAGHEVTIAADGEAAPWSPAVRQQLAMLPPHAGAEARPLAPPPEQPTDVHVRLEPAEEGVQVAVVTSRDHRDLGVLPGDADLETVEAWLLVRTRGRR